MKHQLIILKDLKNSKLIFKLNTKNKKVNNNFRKFLISTPLIYFKKQYKSEKNFRKKVLS